MDTGFCYIIVIVTYLILLLFCVPVTTGRKAVTMVLSFIFFAKPFTIQ